MVDFTKDGKYIAGGDNWDEAYESLQSYAEDYKDEIDPELYELAISFNDWEELMLEAYELERFGIEIDC